MNHSIPFTILAPSLALFAALAAPAAASPILHLGVEINTASLAANPVNGPYSLDFQLNDGSGIGDANNTATLTNFQFGGGAATGLPNYNGTTVSGDLGSSVTITDGDPLVDEFYQTFAPGSTLSFDLSLSTNADVLGTPDLFSFAILDGNLNNLPTQALDQSDTFVEVTLNGSNSTITTAASVDGAIGAPAVSIPELTPSWVLLVSAFLALLLVRERPMFAGVRRLA